MKYEITGHVEGDDKQIAELFSEAFGGRRFDIDAWHRNNRTNPVKPYCVASMWDGDTLVSHISLTPVKAIMKFRECIVAISGTVMARKGYPGASVPVCRWIDEEYADYFIIGFPNDNALALTTRVLRHNYIGDVDFWWKRIDGFDVTDEESPSKLSIEETNAPSIPSDGIPLFDGCSYSLVRNSDFIQWRFLKRKEKGYRYYEFKKQDVVVGYVVLSKYFDSDIDAWQGQIVDFAATDGSVFMALIQFSEKQFRDGRLQVVKLWCTLPLFQECLKHHGYQYGLRPFHVELWHEDLALHEMNLTMADSDVF